MCHQSLVSALWLIALWGVAPSKDSLVEYYEALDDRAGLFRQVEQGRPDSGSGCDDKKGTNDSGEPISFPSSYSSSSITTSASFTEEDFAPNELELAMDQLLDYYSRPYCCPAVDDEGSHGHKISDEYDDDGDDDDVDDDVDNDAIARSFELVCAAIVLQQQQQPPPQDRTAPLTTIASTSKKDINNDNDNNNNNNQHQPALPLPPVVPNGYYTFDGGETKADCAEVTVREILTLLLWDDATGHLDISRLPVTASRHLKDLLLKEQQEHREDEIETAQHQQEQQQKQQKQQLGQGWFDLLSDLPECDYLAVSPNGKAFELAPTSESISKALWHMLVTDGGGTSTSSESVATMPSDSGDGRNMESMTMSQQQHQDYQNPWTSFYNLADFWSGRHSTPQQQDLSTRQKILLLLVVILSWNTK